MTEAVSRGDVVLISLPGDYGKPRPGVVVQSDRFAHHPSVTLIPLTSDLQDAPLFRVTVDPDGPTGLTRPSQAMIDKVMTLRREKVARRIGRIGPREMVPIDAALVLWLGLDSSVTAGDL